MISVRWPLSIFLLYFSPGLLFFPCRTDFLIFLPMRPKTPCSGLPFPTLLFSSKENGSAAALTSGIGSAYNKCNIFK